jgi:hypothetical protein
MRAIANAHDKASASISMIESIQLISVRPFCGSSAIGPDAIEDEPVEAVVSQAVAQASKQPRSALLSTTSSQFQHHAP